MKLSIERCFLANQMFDFLLLAAVSRGLGRFRLSRVAIAATLAALYTLPASAFSWARAPAIQMALLVLLSALLTGQWRFEPCALTGLALIAAAAISGMSATLPMLSSAHPVPKGLACAGTGAALTTALLIRRQRFHTREWLSIYISSQGRQVHLYALLDTGNRLTEPLSREPVLIVEHALIGKLMPREAARFVAYGAVGGGGTLKCFRPDALIVSDGARREAVQAWVAAYPGRLPGGIQALAPAAFAAY